MQIKDAKQVQHSSIYIWIILSVVINKNPINLGRAEKKYCGPTNPSPYIKVSESPVDDLLSSKEELKIM